MASKYIATVEEIHYKDGHEGFFADDLIVTINLGSNCCAIEVCIADDPQVRFATRDEIPCSMSDLSMLCEYAIMHLIGVAGKAWGVSLAIRGQHDNFGWRGRQKMFMRVREKRMLDIKETKSRIHGCMSDGTTVNRKIYEDDDGNRYVAHILQNGTAVAFPLNEFCMDMQVSYIED